jgi:hypothetical protein
MGRAELPGSPQVRELLVRYFGVLQIEAIRDFGVTPGELVNTRFRKQHIQPAREHVIRGLRDHVLYRGKGKKIEIAVANDARTHAAYASEGWKPISYPLMAKLLGFDHSAMLLTIKRIRARESRMTANAHAMEAENHISQDG